ncbi:hypothetical protein J2Z70_005129 [Paenibacillus silagei]|uniref:CBM-cenC domain-containing protein n=1 Tax=Paenibacillus silagei TaxID=1670801 RepID=A0ABS4NY08_9BACL|nr:hypothetical protein [Paenibacillus silagei]
MRNIALVILTLVLMIILPHNAYADDYEYFYNNNGQLESMKSVSNAIDYFYDLNGNLIRKNSNGNFIRNGNFELSDESSGIAKYWNTYNGPGYQQPKGEMEFTAVASGKQAQKIITNGIGGLYQDIKVVDETVYELKGQINLSVKDSGTATMKVDYYNASGNFIGDDTFAEISVQNAWTTIGGAVKTPKGTTMARLHFHLDSSSGATLLIDMVSMYKSTYGNMLENGDFELSHIDGVGDGWRKYGAFGEYELVSSNVTSGTHSQKLTMTNIGGLYQDVAVNGNTLYDLNGRINTESLLSGKVELIVNYFNASGEMLGGTSIAEVRASQKWTTAGETLKTPLNARIARIHIQVDSSSGSAVLVDMFTLKKSMDGNMLANGDFEVSQIAGVADGWAKYGAFGEYQLTKSRVTSGKQSQSLSMTGPGGMYQDVMISGNTLYDVNGRVNISDSKDGSVKLIIDFFDNSGKAISGLSLGDINTLNVWTTIGGTIKTPNGAAVARIHVHTTSLQGSNFVVDMMNFKKSKDGNMLANGDFEGSQIGGVADGWEKYGAYGDYQLTAATVFSGVQAQKAVITGIGGIYQEVAIVPGSNYKLSGFVNISDGPGKTVKVIVNYFNASGKLISGVTLADVNSLNAWTTVSEILKPPAGSVSARIHFHSDSPSGGTFVVDKITFTKE